MNKFNKELIFEFLLNPREWFRRFRRDRMQAEFWRYVHRNGASAHFWPSNIPGDFIIDLRSHLALRILEEGSYEEEITNCIKSLSLKQTGVIVNIGANVGLMSVFLGNTFARKTIAIEPNPEAFVFLIKNVSFNGLDERITCIQACVGSKQDTVNFSYVPGKSEYSSIGEIVHPCVNNEARKTISVPVRPLYELVNDHVAFMLIDTEGAEDLVLEGAQVIIQNDHPIIICECSDELLVKFGSSARKVVTRLFEYGYQVLDLATGKMLNNNVPSGFSSNIQAVYTGKM